MSAGPHQVHAPPLLGERLYLVQGAEAKPVQFIAACPAVDACVEKCALGYAWVQDDKETTAVLLANLRWPQYHYSARPPARTQAMYRNPYGQLEPCLVRSANSLVLPERNHAKVQTAEVEFMRRWELLHSPGSWAEHFDRAVQDHQPEVTRWRNFCRGIKKKTDACCFETFTRHGRLFVQRFDCKRKPDTPPEYQPLEVMGTFTTLPAAGNPRKPSVPGPSLAAKQLTFYGTPGSEYRVVQQIEGKPVKEWYAHDQTITEDEHGYKYTWNNLDITGGGELIVRELKPATKKKRPAALEVLWPAEQRYQDDVLTALWKDKLVGGEKFHQLLRNICVGISRDRAVAWVQAQPGFAAKLRGGAKQEGVVMRPIVPTGPHQHQAVDLVFIPKSTKDQDPKKLNENRMGNDYNYIVMVVVDAFSKFVWIRILDSKHAVNVKAKFQQIWHGFHPPRILQSDQGTEFRAIVEDLCTAFGIDKRLCSAYYSQCNGVVERVNKTLQTYLARRDEVGVIDQVLLDSIAYQYNATPHKTLQGRSPFEVHMNVPADQVMGNGKHSQHFLQSAYPDLERHRRPHHAAVHAVFEPKKFATYGDGKDEWRLELQVAKPKSKHDSQAALDAYEDFRISFENGKASITIARKPYDLPMQYVQVKDLDPQVDHSFLYQMQQGQGPCGWSGYTPGENQTTYFTSMDGTTEGTQIAAPLAMLHAPTTDLATVGGEQHVWQLHTDAVKCLNLLKAALSEDQQAALDPAIAIVTNAGTPPQTLVEAYKNRLANAEGSRAALKIQVLTEISVMEQTIEMRFRMEDIERHHDALADMGLSGVTPEDVTGEVDTWLREAAEKQEKQEKQKLAPAIITAIKALASQKALNSRIDYVTQGPAKYAEKMYNNFIQHGRPFTRAKDTKWTASLGKRDAESVSNADNVVVTDLTGKRALLSQYLDTTIARDKRLAQKPRAGLVLLDLKSVFGDTGATTATHAAQRRFGERLAVQWWYENKGSNATLGGGGDAAVEEVTAMVAADAAVDDSEATVRRNYELVQAKIIKDEDGAIENSMKRQMNAWIQSIGGAPALLRWQKPEGMGGGGNPLALDAVVTSYERWDEAEGGKHREACRDLTLRQEAGHQTAVLQAKAGILHQAQDMMRKAATKLTSIAVNAVVRVSTSALQDSNRTRDKARKQRKKRSSCTDNRWTHQLFRVIHHRSSKQPSMVHATHEYMVEPLYEEAPEHWNSTLQDLQLEDYSGSTPQYRRHYAQEGENVILEQERNGEYESVILEKDRKDAPYATCWCAEHFTHLHANRVWYNRVQLLEVAPGVGIGEPHEFASANTLRQHERAMFPPAPEAEKKLRHGALQGVPQGQARRSRRRRSSGGGSLSGAPVRSVVSGAPSSLSGAPVRSVVPSSLSGAPVRSVSLSGAPVRSVVSGAPSSLSGAPVRSVSLSGAPSSLSGAPVRSFSGAPVRGVPVHAVPTVSGAPRNRYLQRFH